MGLGCDRVASSRSAGLAFGNGRTGRRFSASLGSTFGFIARRSSRSGAASIIASVVCTTGFIAAISCTRTIAAPFKIAVVTAAAVAYSREAGSSCNKNCFREVATNTGSSNRPSSPRRARISEFCSPRFPKPIPGSITSRSRDTPPRVARWTDASNSASSVPITSFIGLSRVQVSGVPRM